MSLIDGLWEWWSMDETSGARRGSHHGRHLTDTNTVDSVSGLRGNAAYFVDGNNEHLTVPAVPQAGLGSFSVQLWLLMLAEPDLAMPVFTGWADGTTEAKPGMMLYFRKDSDRRWTVNDGTGNRLTAPLGSFPNDEWKHLVLSFDRDALEMRAYINGALAHTTAIPEGYGSVDATTNKLSFGNRHDATGYGITGYMDEAAWWLRALGDDEVDQLWNGGTPLTYADIRRPVTYFLGAAYDFTEFGDPGYTGDAIDQHGTTTLINVGGVSGFDDGGGVVGARFTRANSTQLGTSDVEKLSPNADAEHTLEMRFRLRTLGTSFGLTSLDDGRGRDTCAYSIFIQSDGTLTIRKGVGSTYTTFSTGITINDTEWHHFIYRMRSTGLGSTGYEETVFFDGVPYVRSYSWIPTTLPQVNFSLGKSAHDGGHADMDVDFFRSYQGAITDDDAAFLWNGGVPLKYSDLTGGSEEPPAEVIALSGGSRLILASYGTVRLAKVLFGTSATVCDTAALVRLATVLGGTSELVASHAGTIRLANVLTGKSATVIDGRALIDVVSGIALRGTSALLVKGSGAVKLAMNLSGGSTSVLQHKGTLRLVKLLSGRSGSALAGRAIMRLVTQLTGTSSIQIQNRAAVKLATLLGGTSAVVVRDEGEVFTGMFVYYDNGDPVLFRKADILALGALAQMQAVLSKTSIEPVQ